MPEEGSSAADACSLQLGQHVKVTVEVPFADANQASAASGGSTASSPPGSASLWEPARKSRSYTPVVLPFALPSSTLLRGNGALAANNPATPTLDLLVKVYPTGVVSSSIDSLKLGETVAVSQAAGGLPWTPEEFADICMVYGGTGITPMLGIIKHLRELDGCETNVHVVACNRAPEDILLKDQLEQCMHEGFGRFNVTHVLSNVASSSEASGVERGRINPSILQTHLPPAGDGVLVLICGRPSFAQGVASILKRTGHAYHVFG